MEIVYQGDQDIIQLISVFKNNAIYSPSSYLLRKEMDDGTLLLNGLTGEVILLSAEEKYLFDKLPAPICEQLRPLATHGFIIPETVQEERRIEQLRSIFLKRRETEGVITRYIILPTTNCNARCFYCYESNIKHVNMTKETAEKLVDYISKHHGDKRIGLSWFGGEPTLGKKRIDQICCRLKELGISYTSDIVSNGYLFDRELVKQAKDLWHLHKVQITLDGTEEVYNKTKAYVGIKDNAYQRVIRNIGYFLDEKIHVSIRLNMDNHNVENSKVLIDELAERFGGDENFAVYVRQLHDDVGFSPIPHSENDLLRLKEQFLGIQQKLEKVGWPQIRDNTLPKLKVCFCMADDPCSVQCTPDGILGKCEDCIYDHTVGTLEDGIINDEEIKRWREVEPLDNCAKCVLRPSCTHLLKHCATKPTECPVTEKEYKIKLYYEKMEKVYEEWKSALSNA